MGQSYRCCMVANNYPTLLEQLLAHCAFLNDDNIGCFRVLLEGGANRNILTDQGERPIDLVDPTDLKTIAVMLSPLEKKR